MGAGALDSVNVCVHIYDRLNPYCFHHFLILPSGCRHLQRNSIVDGAADISTYVERTLSIAVRLRLF